MNTDNMNLSTPVAIVVAGALVAAALYFALGNSGGNVPSNTDNGQANNNAPAQYVRGVQPDDHIKGSPDAEVVIVEYSDTECPYCKNHHQTMNQIIDEYDDSQVAWVYRHFPLEQLHPTAPRQAEATECAAELGGNDGFWAYTDRLFEVTPSNNQLPDEELFNIAEYAGLDTEAFTQCLESGDMAERVQEDLDEVLAAGGRGTPHNIIIVGGEQIALEGGQSVSGMRQIIDQLLSE